MQTKAFAGLPIGDGKLTVGQWLEQWLCDLLPKKASVKSSNTIDNYTWAVRKHLIPALGSKRLRALRPEDVEKMLLSRAEAGMARNSLVRLRSVLNRALRDAQARHKLSWNVATVVGMTRKANDIAPPSLSSRPRSCWRPRLMTASAPLSSWA